MAEKTVRFSVEGEWFTEWVREQVFSEGKDPQKIIDIMRGFMRGTDQTDEEISRQAEDVLLGRAEFRGNPRDGSWHLTIFEAGEETEKWNAFEKFAEASKANNELRERVEALEEKYSAAIDNMYDGQRKRFLESIGEMQEDDTPAILRGFLDRMLDDDAHETADYGWLEPNGTFHEVEWGEHTKWADDYMRKHVSLEEWMETEFYNAGDFLTQRGWVLLHNPAQGIAIPTKDPSRSYTKAQRDFLYGYYYDRKQIGKANEIMEE